MTAPSWSLQVALHAVLSGDVALATLLGADRIYDHVPRGRDYPYVTYGETVVRDWSTGTETGHEHLVTLHVWSQAPDRQEAEEIVSAVIDALHDKPLAPVGHHVVSLRSEFSETRRDPDGETFHGLVRLRALTEPTP